MAELSVSVIEDAITKCYNYLQNNKGGSKPNACNDAGIPYHAREVGYHWQIHENSTTSECLSLMCRAMIECGYTAYAAQLADFIINNLTHDDIPTVHWLVNLIDNGVEMETDMCGNYDSASFLFTGGVGLIPTGSPYYGEKVIPYIDSRYNGIIAVYSSDATFPYRDLYLEPNNGTTYTVNNFSQKYYNLKTHDSFTLVTEDGDSLITECFGCEVTLDENVTNTLQVYYGYRNNDILDENEIYRTYPLNTKCVVTPNTDYQISNAVDGTQWTIIALDKLAAITGNSAYSDYATQLRNKLIADQEIGTKDYSLFDATNRGLSWFALFKYDENVGRNTTLTQIDKDYTRFSFNSGSGVTQWGIGNAFTWGNTNLLTKVKGDGSNNLRQIVINDGVRDYYASWYDDSTSEKILNFKRGNFTATDNIFLEASRLPYLEPYTVGWNAAGSSWTTVDYDSTFEDSELIRYALWHRWTYSIPNVVGAGALFGTGHIEGVETNSETNFRFLLAANADTNIYYKIYDANNTEIIGKYVIDLNTTPKEFTIRINSDFFNGTPVHPIKNFELFKDGAVESRTVYIGTMRIGRKKIPANPIQSIKFETRQTTAGHFDIAYSKLQNGNEDRYLYSGVPCFTLEYSEIGLMGWRSGSYTGYTNPFSYTAGNFNSYYACKFIYDSAQEYYKRYNKRGPLMPVYLRNLGENQVYGTLSEWGWTGPDPNVYWAGFQYRALANMADHRFFNKNTISANELGFIWGVLNGWAGFLYTWIQQNNNIPSEYHEDGSILANYESPDFYGLVGRAMLLKYLTDYDKRALYIYTFCYDRLLDLQQVDGSFKAPGQDTYGFHQAEALLFLAELKNYFNDYRYIAGMSTFTFTPNQLYTSSVEFRTSIFESFAGKEVRTSETQYPIRRWRLSFDKNNTNLNTIRAFFNSIKGRYSTFNWTWPTSLGGDGNSYVCRLADDNMEIGMQHMGYGNFQLVFETIDTNAYSNLTSLDMPYNADYKQTESQKSAISDMVVANMAVNLQWQSAKKRWILTFEKNGEDRQWLENFFISKKGKFKQFQFIWDEAMGGDGVTYNVRFDTDSIDFDVLYYGYGKIQVPIVEVL